MPNMIAVSPPPVSLGRSGAIYNRFNYIYITVRLISKYGSDLVTHMWENPTYTEDSAEDSIEDSTGLREIYIYPGGRYTRSIGRKVETNIVVTNTPPHLNTIRRHTSTM